MNSEFIGSDLKIRALEVSFNGRKFDTEDLLNPAALSLKTEANKLINNILETQKQNGFNETNFDIRLHIIDNKEVRIKVSLPWTARIRRCQQELTFKGTAGDEFGRAAKAAGDKGIGVVPTPPPEQTFAQKCVAIAKKICNLPYRLLNYMINFNSQTLDFGSVARNTTRAISPSCVAFPTMLIIGGWMCIFTGAWLTLVAICRTMESIVLWRDTEHFMTQLGLIAANFGFLLMGISMALGGDLIATIGGLGFYSIFTAMYIINLVKDCTFRHNLNQKLKTGTKQDITDTLQWLQKQAQNKEEFIRRTNENLYRRVQNEATYLLGSEEADIAQALYLIEAVSKQNYKQIYVDVLSLLIGVFGLVACLPMLQEAIQFTAALFAVSAVIWLFWGDFQFPDNLKDRVVNWLWKNHHKDFEEMLNRSKCLSIQQSPISSPISELNAISPGTQPLLTGTT